MRPIAVGETAPPRLPIMFMVPESVPAYLPPTSIHVPQEPGITRSLQKLAKPIATMADTGLARCTERMRSRLAPVNPMQAMSFRVRETLLSRRAMGVEIRPQKNDPRPPKNRGRTLRSALFPISTPREVCKYVGSHVM